MLKLPCGHATIIADDDSSGHAITGDQWAIWEHWLDQYGKHRQMPTVWHARIMASMAGAEAERELLGFCHGGDGDDRTQIAFMGDMIMDTFSPAWDRWEQRLRRQTARLVRRHRHTIEGVARALVDRHTLQADEDIPLLDSDTIGVALLLSH